MFDPTNLTPRQLFQLRGWRLLGGVFASLLGLYLTVYGAGRHLAGAPIVSTNFLYAVAAFVVMMAVLIATSWILYYYARPDRWQARTTRRATGRQRSDDQKGRWRGSQEIVEDREFVAVFTDPAENQ